MSSAKKKHALTDAETIAKRDQSRDTRARFEQLIKEYPRLTPKELHERLGVSVARIHQLADAVGKEWVLVGRWRNAK